MGDAFTKVKGQNKHRTRGWLIGDSAPGSRENQKAKSHTVTTTDPKTCSKTADRAVGLGSIGIAPLVMCKEGFFQKRWPEARALQLCCGEGTAILSDITSFPFRWSVV